MSYCRIRLGRQPCDIVASFVVVSSAMRDDGAGNPTSQQSCWMIPKHKKGVHPSRIPVLCTSQKMLRGHLDTSKRHGFGIQDAANEILYILRFNTPE